MLNRYLIAGLCAIVMANRCDRRERILFVNQAPESVLVSIEHESSPPLARNIIESGARRFYFPSEMSFENPLYIWVESSTAELHYTLRLTVNLHTTLMRSCRSFGELVLQRGDYTVASIGASILENGFILVYTKDYELEIHPYDLSRRPKSLHPHKKCTSCARMGCRAAAAQESATQVVSVHP